MNATGKNKSAWKDGGKHLSGWIPACEDVTRFRACRDTVARDCAKDCPVCGPQATQQCQCMIGGLSPLRGKFVLMPKGGKYMPTVCSVPGCLDKVRALGLCMKHYCARHRRGR